MSKWIGTGDVVSVPKDGKICESIAAGASLDMCIIAVDQQLNMYSLTHSCVRLSNTTAHTAHETSCSWADAHTSNAGLNFGSSEEQNAAFGGSLYPCLQSGRGKGRKVEGNSRSHTHGMSP